MAKIVIDDGLPYTEVTLRANGKSLTLAHVLIDTGSGACAFKTDDLEKIDIQLEGTDRLVFLKGIGGGEEAVVKKRVEAIEVGDLIAAPFPIQMGALDYDFDAMEIRKK